MKIRTFLILVLNLAVTAAAALLIIRNREILSATFQVTDTTFLPIYAVLGMTTERAAGNGFPLSTKANGGLV